MVKMTYTLFLLLLINVCASTHFNFNTPSEVIQRSGRVIGIRGSDDSTVSFILGGLFPVHRNNVGGSGCDTSTIARSIERIEAMLYAIDTINSDNDLLPGLTLGYDIRDTCGTGSIGLFDTTDIVLANNEIQVDTCEETLFNNRSVLAVIGAAASSVSVPVASFLGLVKTPQISYSSTSSILSNRDQFEYFFRTIPPDDRQAQAIMDLILYFKWNHISTIYSNNQYGAPAHEKLINIASLNDICIDLNEAIDSSFTIENFNELAMKVMNSSANVIILFASLSDVIPLLETIENIQETTGNRRNFTWIGGDSWTASVNVKKYSSVILGMWGTLPTSETYQSYDEYLLKLTQKNNIRNIWYDNDYIQFYYNCSSVQCDDVSPVGAENSTHTYKQGPVIPRVIDAVYSVATALSNYLSENCEIPIVWYDNNQTCKGSNVILNGEILRGYLQTVNFTSPTGHHVAFDENGNINSAKYTILNYQIQEICTDCSEPAQYNFVEVGYWDGSLTENKVQLFVNITEQFGVDNTGNIIYQQYSQCQECNAGYIKRIVSSSCCGTCHPCLGQNYSNSMTSTQCEICPENTWGNKPLTGSDGCVGIEELYLKPGDGWGIALIVLGCTGFLSVVIVTAVFIRFWKTPIIESSGREQMILILVAITTCFLTTALFLLKPSPTICGLKRIASWFCFALILSALLVKLIDITRALLKKETTKTRCIFPSGYQVLLTFLLVGGELILVVLSLIVVPPYVNTIMEHIDENQNDFPILKIQCFSPHIATTLLQVVYLAILVLVCNALAVITIQSPANFNESKYVAFSAFSLGIIWISFMSSYFSTNFVTQNAVLCLFVQLSAFAVLIPLFGPRIFIMLAFPNMNNNIHKNKPWKIIKK